MCSIPLFGILFVDHSSTEGWVDGTGEWAGPWVGRAFAPARNNAHSATEGRGKPLSTAFWDVASTNEMRLRNNGRLPGGLPSPGTRATPRECVPLRHSLVPVAGGPWAVSGRPAWWTTTRCWGCLARPLLRPSRKRTASWRSSGTPTKTQTTRKRQRGDSNKWPKHTKCCQTPRKGTSTTGTARQEWRTAAAGVVGPSRTPSNMCSPSATRLRSSGSFSVAGTHFRSISSETHLRIFWGVGGAPGEAEAEGPHPFSLPSVNFQHLGVVFLLLMQDLIPLVPWGMGAFLPSPCPVVVVGLVASNLCQLLLKSLMAKKSPPRESLRMAKKE